MNKRIIILAVLAISITAGIVTAMPAIRKWTASPEPQPSAAETDAVAAAELLALEEMSRLFHRLDSITDFEVTGDVVTTDPADTAGNMTQRYHYARLGDQVYYRSGQQETFVLTAGNFTIDHLVKKIFIAPPGKAAPSVFPDSKQMAAFLTGEGYAVSRKVSGGLTWIELNRPNHITCKTYRVGFNEDGFIRESYSRLTDFSDPLNDAKDKTITATASRWAIGAPPPGIFDVTKYLERTQDGFSAKGAASNYEIIVTR